MLRFTMKMEDLRGGEGQADVEVKLKVMETITGGESGVGVHHRTMTSTHGRSARC